MVLLLAFLIGQGRGTNAGEVPSTARSKRAIERVTPDLTRDLDLLGLSLGSPIFIRIFKSERELELWIKGADTFVLFRTYPIVGMSGELGPKRRKGDMQAPEGFYFVTPDKMNPGSNFHLSFDVGYPNAYDRAQDCTGSLIMVHGNQVSAGCFAMTDEKIEEVYALADAAFRAGQKFFRVHCFPFRMSQANLDAQDDSEWHSFWTNLKEGYDAFDTTKIPPDVTVQDDRYAFSQDHHR